MEFPKITTVITSLLPFIIGAIWWVIRKSFTHDQTFAIHEERLKSHKNELDDLKNLKIGETLRDHHTRIKLMEDAYTNSAKDTANNFRILISETSEIKGLLESKRDKK